MNKADNNKKTDKLDDFQHTRKNIKQGNVIPSWIGWPRKNSYRRVDVCESILLRDT